MKSRAEGGVPLAPGSVWLGEDRHAGGAVIECTAGGAVTCVFYGLLITQLSMVTTQLGPFSPGYLCN